MSKNMAAKKSPVTLKAELKKLKKTGLIDLDLRRITDKQLQDKKFRSGLLRVTNKYKDVLNDTVAVAKVKDKTKREALSSRGHRTTRNGFVFISKKKDEQVKVSRSGNITYTREVIDRKTKKKKLEVITEPNINLNNVQTVEDALNAYASMYVKGNHQIAFTYYGNVSKRTYSDVKAALLEIIGYVEKQNEIGTSLNPADIPEIMKSVQLITYVDSSEYGEARTNIKEGRAKLSKYFKKLNKR